MNMKEIKSGIYGGLGRACVGASRKSLLHGGRCAALVVAVWVAGQGTALAGGVPILAGQPEPVHPPRTSEQLEVFGKSSMGFPRSSVDPEWRPESDWDNSTELNNFQPSRWYQAPIDPSWEPESAFPEDDDVTNFNPTRWQMGILAPNWYPKDGFKRGITNVQ